MKVLVLLAQILGALLMAQAQSDQTRSRTEAEYYAAAYAEHYRVPINLVRAIIHQESDWQPCARSSKGAVGLMQLMPGTAERLNVTNRCDVDQNIAGGVRYLAWLMRLFHSDLRLVTAAYYAGEDAISRRGLAYRNPDVVLYVRRIRDLYLRQVRLDPPYKTVETKGDVQ
jgi:soluble lytic murein transglycosylase-like protein